MYEGPVAFFLSPLATGPDEWIDFMTQLKFAVFRNFLCDLKLVIIKIHKQKSSRGTFLLIDNNNTQTGKFSIKTHMD